MISGDDKLSAMKIDQESFANGTQAISMEDIGLLTRCQICQLLFPNISPISALSTALNIC